MKELLYLFWTFFKIGITTFGGGYAMGPIIREKVVEKEKWMSEEEFVDTIAICESTPGPIAINMATYIGYKNKKFWGSLFATIGVILPSFVIILIISLFFERLLENEYFFAAVSGIKACIVFLILKAGIKMLKLIDKKVVPILVFILTTAISISIEFYDINFSSIFIILIGGLIGFITGLIELKKEKEVKK